jgi:hypothetical protein
MRRAIVAVCVLATLFVAACSSDNPPTGDPASVSPGGSTTASPGSSPGGDGEGEGEGGNPSCVAIFNLLEQLTPVQEQFKVAVGNDPAKAAAAKTQVQTKLREVAAELRKASATAEPAVKQAAETAAKGFEAGANDAQLFAPKDEEAANRAFNEAALTWTTQLLATC